MNKKNYLKPELKTRKIELGVFGEYGNGPGKGGGKFSAPDVTSKLSLRME